MSGTTEMIEVCLPRTKGSPLSVSFTLHQNIDTDSWHCDPVLAKVLPHSKRWRNLHVIFESSGSRTIKHACIEESNSGKKLCCLDAPSLQGLYIEDLRYSFGSGGRLLWDWTQWNTPNLQRLITTYSFPHFLPGLSNVNSLRIYLTINDDSVQYFLRNLKNGTTFVTSLWFLTMGTKTMRRISCCMSKYQDTNGIVVVLQAVYRKTTK